MTLWRTMPLLALAVGLAAGPARACTDTIGVVMALSGPIGGEGQAAAMGVRMALRDLDKAGGAAGCDLVADLRDTTSRPSVAAEQARQLIHDAHVRGLIGGLRSPDTIRILAAVTAPELVPQISPGASSPALTRMGEAGKTNGIFFRTIPSDTLRAVAAAQYALVLGYRRLAIIHPANDDGTDMARAFADAVRKLGGNVVSATQYEAHQASYATVATAAMAGAPEALYLVSDEVDGAAIARAWIERGGPQKFLLADGMNSAGFIKAVGAKYLNHAFGLSPGAEPTASTAYFEKNFKPFAQLDPDAPGAARSYDAAAIMGLAIAIAGKPDRALVTASIRAAVDPMGTPVTAGPDGFRRALALIKAHRPIRYVGVSGPIAFDRAGDSAAPFNQWKIAGGKVVSTGQLGTADMAKLLARLGQ